MPLLVRTVATKHIRIDDVIDELDLDKLVVDIIGTLHGDSDLNKIVNFADFVNVANNFGVIGTGWGAGNFNLDNITNFQDFVILANNFGMVATSGQEVPEPTILALLGGMAILAIRYRGTRHR